MTSTTENNDKVALLLGKPKSSITFTLYLGAGDDAQEVSMTAEALSMKEYDKLLAKYPPTETERAQGLNYELDKFAPALIAACMTEPELSLTQAKQLWNGENWSRGDIEGIFTKVLQVNHQESTIPFSARG